MSLTEGPPPLAPPHPRSLLALRPGSRGVLRGALVHVPAAPRRGRAYNRHAVKRAANCNGLAAGGCWRLLADRKNTGNVKPKKQQHKTLAHTSCEGSDARLVFKAEKAHRLLAYTVSNVKRGVQTRTHTGSPFISAGANKKELTESYSPLGRARSWLRSREKKKSFSFSSSPFWLKSFAMHSIARARHTRPRTRTHACARTRHRVRIVQESPRKLLPCGPQLRVSYG